MLTHFAWIKLGTNVCCYVLGGISETRHVQSLGCQYNDPCLYLKMRDPGSFELQFVGSVFADISTSRNGLKKQTQPVGKVCGKKYPSCKRLHVFVHVYFLMSMENTAKLLGVCRCSKLPIEENLLDDWWGSWFVHLTIDSQSDMQAYVGISKYLEMLRFEHIHVYYLYTYIVFGSCKIHLSQCSLVCSYMYTYVYGLSSHLFMNVLIHFCHPLEWLPKASRALLLCWDFFPCCWWHVKSSGCRSRCQLPVGFKCDSCVFGCIWSS